MEEEEDSILQKCGVIERENENENDPIEQIEQIEQIEEDQNEMNEMNEPNEDKMQVDSS